MDSGVTIIVQGVNSLSCHAEGNGFLCNYRVQTKNELSSAMVPSGDPLQGLMKGLGALADFPQEVSQERFELGQTGWWSPGLMERMRKAGREYNRQLQDANE